MKTFYKSLIVLILVLLKTQFIYPQWVQTNGPNNGAVYSLASNGSYLFAGTYGNGAYLSSNFGANWTQVKNGMTAGIVYSLAVTGLNFWTNIFAGTGDGGMYLSTDLGSNWAQKNNGLNTAICVTAFTTSGGYIFAGTSVITVGGVYRSPDNGANWTQVNNGLTSNYVSALAVSSSNIFAGTNGGGVYVSMNNGANWTQVNNGLTTISVNALAVSGTKIYAGTYGGVFLSTNNGTNWSKINNGLTNTSVNCLTMCGTNIFAGTNSGGVFLSTDNGANWTQENITSTTNAVLSLTVNETNIFAGTYGGVVWRRPLSEMNIPVVALTAFIQGLYDGVLFEVPDTITLELHNASSPYALVESQKGVLIQPGPNPEYTGFGWFYFSTAVNGTPYYLVIKHRNAVETWSAAGNSFTSYLLNYDFTSSQSKAYGGNLFLKHLYWCLYSGDINHDGQISFTDLIAVDNDNKNFVTGYTNTDLTGDGQVNFSDLVIVDNNNSIFISKVVPSEPPNSVRINRPPLINKDKR